MVRVSEKFLQQITELAKNGSSTITASNARITNLGTPSADTDAANKSYVDGVSAPPGGVGNVFLGGSSQNFWGKITDGYISPSASISVSKLAAPSTDGYVLTYNTSGGISWKAPSGTAYTPGSGININTLNEISAVGITTSNLSSSANIAETQLAAGGSNKILLGGSSVNSWGQITDSYIASNASIAVSKLASSGTDGYILTSSSGVPTWKPLSGTAGGDLTGSYPNPYVASLTGVAGTVALIAHAFTKSNDGYNLSINTAAATNVNGIVISTGNATSSDGGVTISCGTCTNSTGGHVNITSGTSTNSSGGNVNINGGSATYGSGGSINITSGACTYGNSGNINITTGASNYAGSMTIQFGIPTYGAGGNFTIYGGSSSSTGSAGGQIQMYGGAGSGSVADGGAFYIGAGSSQYSSSGKGGLLQLTGGYAYGTGNGGDVKILAGESGGSVYSAMSSASTPGNINISGGNNWSSTTGIGGDVNISGGFTNVTTTSAGGNVNIYSGYGVKTGNNGSVNIGYTTTSIVANTPVITNTNVYTFSKTKFTNNASLNEHVTYTTSTSYSVQPTDRVIVINNATAGTVTLPASPVAGDKYKIKADGYAVVTTASTKIDSVVGAFAINVGTAVEFTYVNGTIGWMSDVGGVPVKVYLPICSGAQTAGTTYQVIGVIPPTTYSALVNGIPSYTFSAIVSIPDLSTAQVVLYDKTNSTALYTSSIISGLQSEYNFTASITPASGSTLLELWLITPTNTGGNATCFGAGILVT